VKLGQAHPTVSKADQTLPFHLPPMTFSVQPQETRAVPDPTSFDNDLEFRDLADYLEVHCLPIGPQATHDLGVLGPP